MKEFEANIKIKLLNMFFCTLNQQKLEENHEPVLKNGSSEGISHREKFHFNNGNKKIYEFFSVIIFFLVLSKHREISHGEKFCFQATY
jgi:hypothetical protein